MSIDWSNAPEGATHFLPEQDSRGWVSCWYKNVAGTWFARNEYDREWNMDNDYLEDFVPLLIEREKPWTGEGLPPAGTVCEVKGCMGHYLQWEKVTVFAVRGKTVMFDMEDGRWGQTDSHDFRPIRTPEQIAADERESAVTEMKQCFDSVSDHLMPTSNKYLETLFGALHDAGYRKQVAP